MKWSSRNEHSERREANMFTPSGKPFGDCIIQTLLNGILPTLHNHKYSIYL